jgi:serine/threonine-protein kinase
MLNTTVLERYEIKKQVRENELFTEYWGEDTKMGRDVMAAAIHVVPAAEFFTRFNPVNKKFAGVHSRHAPDLVEIGEVDGRAVIIRQHVEGQSLRGILDSGHNLPLELILGVAQQLGEYLDLLHQAGLIQIAFELEDILISAGDSAHVTNFGFAQGVDLGGLLAANKIPTRTSYAPELLKGGKADARTDFYSLGALLFEALTGKKPSASFETSDKTVAIEDFFPSRLRMGISSEWDELTAKCLNPNPAKRIQSAVEFLHQVDEIRRSMNTVATNTPLGMEDSLVGQTLGSYRLVSRLGQGGMATVYKAYEPALDRYVAVKVLPQFFAKDPVFVQRFRREAKAVAQLNHPNIVPIYSYGETNGITYIAMQFVIGDTLKHEGQKFTFEESLRLLSPIARALGYAHQRGVVHRDIKPSNILIAEDGNWPLLADFGLAQMAQASGKLTESGVGMGTPMYMSPEQGQGEKVDQRTDIYSLGIVLYELVTGDVPFRADTPMAIVIKHISAPMPMPSNVNPDIPDYLEAIILKSTAKNPDDRYQSAEDMARAMENALSRLPSEPAARISPPPVVTLPAQTVASPVAAASPASPASESKSEARQESRPSAPKKILRTVLFSIAGIVGLCCLGVALMGVFKICPPQGPWSQPPWCEGSPYQFTVGDQQPTQQPTSAPVSPPVATDGTFGDILFQDDFDGSVSPRWMFTCDPNTAPWIADNIDGRTVFHSQPPNPPGRYSCAEIRDTNWKDYAIQFDFRFLKPDQFNADYFSLRGRVVNCPPTTQAMQQYGVVISPDKIILKKERCEERSQQDVFSSDKNFEREGWHTLQYILIGNRIQLLIDGKPYMDYTDEQNWLTGGDLWLETGSGAEVLFDNLKVYEIIPPASTSAQPDVVLDNFDGEDSWGAAFEEGTNTKIDCLVDDSHSLRDSNYLAFDFDVAANSWGTCGFDYESVKSWQGKGIAFLLRSDQANMPYIITIFDGITDGANTYRFEGKTPPESVNNWARVEIPWSEILGVEWESNAGKLFDPARVGGFRFQIDAGEKHQTGKLWVDDLGLMQSYTPPAGAATSLFSDDFEHAAWTYIESYVEENSDTKAACSLDDTIAHEGSSSLKFNFDVAPNSWASCGFSFDIIKDWRAGKGIRFYIRSDKTERTYYVNITASPADKDENYVYEATTTSESLNGWTQVEIPWKDFLRASWEDQAGSPLDPLAIVGLWLEISPSPDARESGTIWVDDIQVIP